MAGLRTHVCAKASRISLRIRRKLVRAEILADYGALNIASAFCALALWHDAPNVEEAYYFV